MRFFLIYILLFAYQPICFSQNKYSIGIAGVLSYNRATAGIEINHFNKRYKQEIPSLTLLLQAGLLGGQNYKFNHYNSNQLVTYYTKFRLIGFELSLIKEILIKKHFFFGIGTGYNTVIDYGTTTSYNPEKNTRKSDLHFQTIFILTNFGYSFVLNKKNSLNIRSNFYFFIPFAKGKFSYLGGEIPNSGTEVGLLISFNHKL